MIYTEQTKKAMKLAYSAHQNQKDKADMPYVFHPFYIATQMPDEKTTVVALLHDVIEDSDYTVADLMEMGFDNEIIAVLDLLTHKPEDSYMDYIKKISENDIAKTVKLADLRHNCELSRFDQISEKELARIDRYKQAIDFLLG